MKTALIKAIQATLDNWQENCSSQKNYAEAREHLLKWLNELTAV